MALIVALTVVPQSPDFKIIVAKNGHLKCWVKAAPEKGAANKELIKGLAKMLAVPQDTIEIISGLTSPKKRIKIHTAMTEQDFYQLCGIPWQKNIQ